MVKLGLSIQLHAKAHRAPAGHPETSERLALAAEALEMADLPLTWVPIAAEPASIDRLKAVHNQEYLRQLRTIAATGGGYFDADTYITPKSYEAARMVSGALCSAVDLSLSGTLRKSLVIGRPPGHHAESTRAMGFCLINHIAVAAARALEDTKVKRVSVVDFDLHHGNGTQEIFYDRADVQFISTHQYPFYPGSGAATERGAGDGQDYTLNIPLPAGAGDSVLLEAFDELIFPALEDYAPDLILVSAGFDGHGSDPLGELRFTPNGFQAMARRLSRFADRVCEGRLVTFVEGGYNPEANRDSIIHYVKGLVGP